jgi:predicted DNA binding CopG/RHH family protein
MWLLGKVLEAVKRAAKHHGIHHQRFIRQALENALSARK